MPDPTSVLEQESRTVQEILDAADGDITTSVTDAELVLVNRATGSKLFLRRNSKIRTADGTVAAITDTLTCRSCKSIISHQASTRCTHCRAITCISCGGQLQECKACSAARWWPRFWMWLCSA